MSDLVDYIQEAYDDNQLQFSFDAANPQSFTEWRTKLLAELRLRLGPFPIKPVALDPAITETVECDGYMRYRVEYSVDRALRTPAYVLVPNDGRQTHPAVVACHGHGYGSKDVVGLTPEGEAKTGDPGYHKDFAVELVWRGFLVIAPDWAGFGELRFDEDKAVKPGQKSCDRLSASLLLLGKTVLGLRLLQLQRTLDYLETRQDTDASRIGCYGISGGGTVCAFGSALDERIRAAVISGYVNTFRGSILHVRHCICNFVPGLLNYAEMPDYIGLIAPRPLLVESAEGDKIFPIDSARAAVGRIREIYRAAGAEERVEHDVFPGGHEISGRVAYDWLVRQLS